MGRTKGTKNERGTKKERIYLANLQKKDDEMSSLLFKLELEKHFTRLKEAPLEEYLSRICHIASILKEKRIL